MTAILNMTLVKIGKLTKGKFEEIKLSCENRLAKGSGKGKSKSKVKAKNGNQK